MIKTESLPGATVLRIAGEIDLSSSPALRSALSSAVAAKPQRVVVELSGVPYMDSSGLATLIEAFQHARRSGVHFVLASIQPRVRSVLEIARLDSIFVLAPTVEEACRA